MRAADGRIVEANAAAEAAYGYPRAELMQLDVAALRAAGQRSVVGEQMNEAAAGGILFETEHRPQGRLGVSREVSSRGIVTVGGDDAASERGPRHDDPQADRERARADDGAARSAPFRRRSPRWAATAELRDPYTAGHQRRVADLACAIAAELGWDAGRIESLRTASLLHDLGKIVVPAEILSKPGKLTDTEFLLIRQHAGAGAEILADIDFQDDIAAMVRQHHERLDGSGYPAGLKGADILPEARILAVADVVEAMVSHRPYRPALPLETALAEIEQGSGRRYDADVCAACARLMREGRFVLGTA